MPTRAKKVDRAAERVNDFDTPGVGIQACPSGLWPGSWSHSDRRLVSWHRPRLTEVRGRDVVRPL